MLPTVFPQPCLTAFILLWKNLLSVSLSFLLRLYLSGYFFYLPRLVHIALKGIWHIIDIQKIVTEWTNCVLPLTEFWEILSQCLFCVPFSCSLLSLIRHKLDLLLDLLLLSFMTLNVSLIFSTSLSICIIEMFFQTYLLEYCLHIQQYQLCYLIHPLNFVVQQLSFSFVEVIFVIYQICLAIYC